MGTGALLSNLSSRYAQGHQHGEQDCSGLLMVLEDDQKVEVLGELLLLILRKLRMNLCLLTSKSVHSLVSLVHWNCSFPLCRYLLVLGKISFTALTVHTICFVNLYPGNF